MYCKLTVSKIPSDPRKRSIYIYICWQFKIRRSWQDPVIRNQKVSPRQKISIFILTTSENKESLPFHLLLYDPRSYFTAKVEAPRFKTRSSVGRWHDLSLPNSTERISSDRQQFFIVSRYSCTLHFVIPGEYLGNLNLHCHLIYCDLRRLSTTHTHRQRNLHVSPVEIARGNYIDRQRETLITNEQKRRGEGAHA